MSSLRTAVAALALCAVVYSGCSCEPLVPSPDGGSGGGAATGGGGTTGGGGATGGGGMTGGGGGMTGGGGGMTGGGGGMTGGGGGMTGGGGGMTGGGGGATGGGGGAAVQFTEWVRDQIVNNTSATNAPQPATAYEGLPDDAPITYSPGFFDGGTN